MFKEKSTDEILEMLFGSEESLEDSLRDEVIRIREICDSFLDLFEEENEKKDPEKKYYSGKIVCVETKDSIIQKGKIYEVINGEIKIVNGNRTLKGAFYETIDQINEELPAKFIELLD